MLQLTPILLSIVIGLALHRFAVWRSAQALDAQSTPLDDRRLAPVLDRLARALDLPALRVHVYEIAPVNGLAAPDGRIFLTRGFLDRYEAGAITDKELASVVAHELGHVALGHARRRMIDFSGQNAIRTALAMVLGRLLPGIGVLIANALTGLLAARLSRQDEYEADAYAAALMTKAGLGTGPQVSLLGKLDRMAGMGGGAPVWLASHPPSAERIRAIETLAAGWRAR
jgi:putative metalloprotease